MMREKSPAAGWGCECTVVASLVPERDLFLLLLILGNIFKLQYIPYGIIRNKIDR